jgi:hypothetical protein
MPLLSLPSFRVTGWSTPHPTAGEAARVVRGGRERARGGGGRPRRWRRLARGARNGEEELVVLLRSRFASTALSIDVVSLLGGVASYLSAESIRLRIGVESTARDAGGAVWVSGLTARSGGGCWLRGRAFWGRVLRIELVSISGSAKASHTAVLYRRCVDSQLVRCFSLPIFGCAFGGSGGWIACVFDSEKIMVYSM